MRQKPIGDYIVDFYCSRLKLAIEIDGESHDGKFEKDEIRQHYLKSLGLSILRFNDLEIKKDIYNVLRVIEGWVQKFEINNPRPPFIKGD